MNIATIITTLIAIIGVLVALVNIVVEVLKKVLWDKVPTNALAVIVSLVLTLLAFFAWAAYTGSAILWYMVSAAVILSFLVAYAAMFGFDKLKEILKNLAEGTEILQETSTENAKDELSETTATKT